MAEISCPRCGETDRLAGRRDGEAIHIACEACGATWDRDSTRRCGMCGSADLRYTPEPLWARGRGEQRTPAGKRDAWTCYACGTRDATASRPSTPD